MLWHVEYLEWPIWSYVEILWAQFVYEGQTINNKLFFFTFPHVNLNRFLFTLFVCNDFQFQQIEIKINKNVPTCIWISFYIH